MDLKKEYCQLNGYSKFNKYNENNYTKFLEKKITELEQALQLQQTGVSGSDLHDKIIKQIPDAYKEQISKTIKKHYR